MKSDVLLHNFIKPSLNYMKDVCPNINTQASEQIMLAIAAQESHCGAYFQQINGPAKGIWQVEPKTETDVYKNYLSYRPSIEQQVLNVPGVIPVSSPLITYPLYCCIIARLHLYRQPFKMPELNDKDSMWEIYKTYYNSYLGKATKEEWDYHWNKYVAPLY